MACIVELPQATLLCQRAGYVATPDAWGAAVVMGLSAVMWWVAGRGGNVKLVFASMGSSGDMVLAWVSRWWDRDYVAM